MEAVRERFGVAAVGPAALLGSDGLRVKRPGDTQWGPRAVRTNPRGGSGQPVRNERAGKIRSAGRPVGRSTGFPVATRH